MTGKARWATREPHPATWLTVQLIENGTCKLAEVAEPMARDVVNYRPVDLLVLMHCDVPEADCLLETLRQRRREQALPRKNIRRIPPIDLPPELPTLVLGSIFEMFASLRDQGRCGQTGRDIASFRSRFFWDEVRVCGNVNYRRTFTANPARSSRSTMSAACCRSRVSI